MFVVVLCARWNTNVQSGTASLDPVLSHCIAEQLDESAYHQGNRRIKRAHCRLPLVSTHQLGLIWFLLLLLLSGDIEKNPGPVVGTIHGTPSTATSDQCPTCAMSVNDDDMGVACDLCHSWFHSKCQGISNQEYKKLSKTTKSWTCTNCSAENNTTQAELDSFQRRLVNLGRFSFSTGSVNAHSNIPSAESLRLELEKRDETIAHLKTEVDNLQHQLRHRHAVERDIQRILNAREREIKKLRTTLETRQRNASPPHRQHSTSSPRLTFAFHAFDSRWCAAS